MATQPADKTDKTPATPAPATPAPVTPAPVTPAPDAAGKGETRLFQTAPGVKKQLTKAEAKKAGFFWKDEPKAK